MLKYRCFCKSIKNNTVEEPGYSHKWVGAKRAWLCVFDDRLECGNWIIPFADVVDVVRFSTRQMGIPVSILSVRTQDNEFQFGINPWNDPFPHLPMKYSEERVRLKYSTFSILVRAIVVVFLLYLGLKMFE